LHLELQAGIKKRTRAGTSWGAAVGQDEAAALLWLRTGEKVEKQVVPESRLEKAVECVRKMLQLEAAGLSDCGSCSRCKQGSACIRASNRKAASEGSRAAQLAEEAGRLIGRRFEVCPFRDVPRHDTKQSLCNLGSVYAARPQGTACCSRGHEVR
jgi:hypothetical protein